MLILLLSCLTIFLIITLSSVASRLPVAPFHLVLLGFIFFLFLGCVPLLPHFAEFAVFISVSSKLVLFPKFGEVAFCGRRPLCPALCPLLTRSTCCRGAPCRLHGSFRYGGRHGGCGRSPVQSGCQALPGEEAAASGWQGLAGLGVSASPLTEPGSGAGSLDLLLALW